MNRREILMAAAGCAVATATKADERAEGEWSEGPMTLGDLAFLSQALIDQGIDPATPVASYVDGRPVEYGGTEGHPAILRAVTFIKPTYCHKLATRLHWQRHKDGTSTVVVALA